MPTFETRSKVYPFTTENLAGYMPNLNLEGKKVLTVTGSADHMINSFLFGAEDVVCFDINTLATFFAELKIKALKRLDFEQFKRFFLLGDGGTMDFKVYSSIRNELSLGCVRFFDGVYRINEMDGEEVRRSKLFNKRFDIDKLRIRSNPYLHSEEQYEAVRARVKSEVKLINSSAKDLASKLDEEFGVVMLSNLADYTQSMFPHSPNHLERFCRKIVSPIRDHLSQGGVICGAYVYDASPMGEKTPRYKGPVDDPAKRRTSFETLEMAYEERKFPCIVPGKEDREDLVVILTK
ncbi:MAG: BtaA family protein [archaeon]|nr:BtaA family protein [archaeon]MCR4323396.1 BtaA family protein [Nanoarchaeota archaeon]